MDGWEKFNETLLPEKEDFYCHLNMEDIRLCKEDFYCHLNMEDIRLCKDF